MPSNNGFFCEKCNYRCEHRGDWKKHVVTAKHVRLNANVEGNTTNSYEKFFKCKCGKRYAYDRSLRRHEKNCKDAIQPSYATTELIEKLLVENQKIREDIRNMSANNTTTVYNADYQPQYITAIKDSHVNMQIFLNDKCSQAINLKSFIENLEVNLEDLDETRERGLAFSLGRVLLRGLKELEFNKRPIHCSDLRTTEMYVRDNDTWDIDRREASLRNAIGVLSARQISQIQKWEEEHPNWTKTETGKQVYAEMVRIVLLNTSENERARVENDVIKTIARETLIDE
jgi:hypothetical protein